MKPHTLLLLCLVSLALPARAQNSTTNAPARPTAEAASAKPASSSAAAIPAVKPTESVVAKEKETKATAVAAAPKAESQGTMQAVEVNGLNDFKPTAPGAMDLRAEQKAAMALRLAGDSGKPSLAPALSIERPALSAPKLPTAIDSKNLAVAFPAK